MSHRWSPAVALFSRGVLLFFRRFTTGYLFFCTYSNPTPNTQHRTNSTQSKMSKPCENLSFTCPPDSESSTCFDFYSTSTPPPAHELAEFECRLHCQETSQLNLGSNESFAHPHFYSNYEEDKKTCHCAVGYCPVVVSEDSESPYNPNVSEHHQWSGSRVLPGGQGSRTYQ